MVKDSISIKNDVIKYPRRLECDDIQGIIRITNNLQARKTGNTNITHRNVIITEAMKNQFCRDKTGYNDKDSDPTLPFKGSYISRDVHPIAYDKWLHIMYDIYNSFKKEKQKQKVEYEQLSIFDKI